MSTIEKALGLLDHFSGQMPEIGLSEFKRLTDFDKGTVHRYLTQLKDCGFLEQNPATRAYRLGPAVLRLSTVREKTVPLLKTVAPIVDELAAQTGELVHSALPQTTGMSALYAADGGKGGIRVSFDEAEILPFHATASGLAQLAFGAPDLATRVLQAPLPTFTDHSPRTAHDVEQAIARTQEQGHAASDQTFEADVCSLAVPFFDQTLLARGTLAIATPAARMTKTARDAFLAALIQKSQTLSRNLGGDIPPTLQTLWTPIRAAE